MELIETRRRILLNAPHIVTPTPAGIMNFSTDMKAPLKECKVHFSPVQEGTGDPSPTNVRPISGWDGINCSLSHDKFIFIPSDTTIFPWTQNNVTLIYEGNGRYRFSGINETNSGIHFAFTISTYNYEGYGVFYLGSNKPAPVGVNRQLRLRRADETNIWNTYLKYDSDLNDYYINSRILKGPITEVRFTLHPGDGNYSFSPVYIVHEEEDLSSHIYVENMLKTIPAHFSNTVYGGYVDLVSGEIVATHRMIELTGDEGITYTPYKGTTLYESHLVKDSVVNFSLFGQCSMVLSSVKTSTIDGSALIKTNITGGLQFNDVMSYWGLSECTSNALVTQLRAWKMNGTPLQICYELATPIHYPLTPQVLKTLRGTNNIWSNANGNIEVSYWTH